LTKRKLNICIKLQDYAMTTSFKNHFVRRKKSIINYIQSFKFSSLFNVHNKSKIASHTLIQSFKKHLTRTISSFVFFIKYMKVWKEVWF
jgi:hypothetical protein